jgi:hypothetical protein
MGRSAGTVSSKLGGQRPQHPRLGELGQSASDRVAQGHQPVLDEQHGGDTDDRLGQRGDPEDGVAPIGSTSANAL